MRSKHSGTIVRLGAGVGLLLCVTDRAWALLGGTYNPATGGIDGAVNINDFVGATSIYGLTYTENGTDHNVLGDHATVANIEGGYVWNQHEALTRVQTYYPSSVPADSMIVNHATGVGMVIAGSQPIVGNTNYLQAGIAPGSTLWSFAIASSITGNNFEVNDPDFIDAYRTAMKTGINGTTADIVNSSWGTGEANSNNHYYSVAIDALAAQTGKTVVFAAGNSGAGGTVSAPASAYNIISVGALGYTSAAAPYSTVAGFSSRGAGDAFIPTNGTPIPDSNSLASGTTIVQSRAMVNLVAPGEKLYPAYYGGADGGTDLYGIEAAGTSYAAPIVAGGAALMVDVGKIVFGGYGGEIATNTIDARVIKAVLMNSADRIPGWDNGQHMENGVLRTTQSLDYNSGAGRMNLTSAFNQYLGGTIIPYDWITGSTVDPVGWAYGRAGEGYFNDYSIGATLNAGNRMDVTLDWFVNSLLADGSDTPSYGSFDNLDLQVWLLDGNNSPWKEVAESASLYNNVEELSFFLPYTGKYMIRVNWAGEVYDVVNAPNNDVFGLAWSTTSVPEPSSGMMMAGFSGFLFLRRRRRDGRAIRQN